MHGSARDPGVGGLVLARAKIPGHKVIAAEPFAIARGTGGLLADGRAIQFRVFVSLYVASANAAVVSSEKAAAKIIVFFMMLNVLSH